MSHKVAVPGWVHIIIFTVEINYIPGVIFYFDITCGASNISAVHTQFKHHSVVKRCIALANRIFLNNGSISRMAKLIFVVIFIIKIILNVFSYPIIRTFDFFIICQIPKVKFRKNRINRGINFRFLFGCGKPVECICNLGICTVFVFAGNNGRIVADLVMADIVALVRNTGVFPGFGKDSRNLGTGRASVKSEGYGRFPCDHLRTEIEGGFLGGGKSS